MLGKKMKHSRRNGSSEKNKVEKHGMKSSEGNKLSKETLKQVSDLAFYVRYQKRKIEAITRKPETGATEQKRLMRKMTSNASVNSMDAFLAKADLDEMARFLSFCGGVTAEKLGGSKPQRDSARNSEKTSLSEKKTSRKTGTGMKINRRAICERVDSMKLGLKQKFLSNSTVQRTTSTGTISSTDTGYYSVGSERESECYMDEKVSLESVHSLKTAYFPEHNDELFQSTPVSAGRTRKRRPEFESTFTGDQTLTADGLEDLDELQGKSLILEKFMTNQTNPVSSKISRGDISKYLGVTERWAENFCDSDSDMESECSQHCESLDLAFNAGTDGYETEITRQKKLRRESAISNLNRFSLLPCDTRHVTRDIRVNSLYDSKVSSSSLVASMKTANSQQKKLRRESAISNLNRASILTRGSGLNLLYENRALDIEENLKERVGSRQRNLRRESDISNLNRFSLVSRDLKNDVVDESSGFDYSFNCSFPRMDESQTGDFSLDFSCDFDESDSEDATGVDYNESDSVDSFMNTQLCQDISGEITLC